MRLKCVLSPAENTQWIATLRLCEPQAVFSWIACGMNCALRRIGCNSIHVSDELRGNSASKSWRSQFMMRQHQFIHRKQIERENKSVSSRNVLSFSIGWMKSWLRHDEIFALLRWNPRRCPGWNQIRLSITLRSRISARKRFHPRGIRFASFGGE